MQKYHITKGAYYYRPNAEGYTTDRREAGLYSLSEADELTHPNGPDGPRDGLSYEEATSFSIPSITADAVRAYRERTGASMWDAKNALIKEIKLGVYERLMRHGTLEDKVQWLLERWLEKQQST